MWGIEVIRRFGTFNYLFLGLISTSFENPHGVSAQRWQTYKNRTMNKLSIILELKKKLQISDYVHIFVQNIK